MSGRTMAERGQTKIERHKKKRKGWRGDAARHSEARKRSWEKRRRNEAEKARIPPTKKEFIKTAKKEFRRRKGLPEGDGK